MAMPALSPREFVTMESADAALLTRASLDVALTTDAVLPELAAASNAMTVFPGESLDLKRLHSAAAQSRESRILRWTATHLQPGVHKMSGPIRLAVSSGPIIFLSCLIMLVASTDNSSRSLEYV